jgi:hypothetical protein
MWRRDGREVKRWEGEPTVGGELAGVAQCARIRQLLRAAQAETKGRCPRGCCDLFVPIRMSRPGNS